MADSDDLAHGLQYLCRNDAVAELRRAGHIELLGCLHTAVAGTDSGPLLPLVSAVIDTLQWRADYRDWRIVGGGTRELLDDYPGTEAVLCPVYTCPLTAGIRCGRRQLTRGEPPECTLGGRAMDWTDDEFAD
ncbi:hypothetical protein [Nocardia sp. NPDC052566]|uniref:hypothetical protein n=1 Tax=Nocardia sp. NPDC052566 TaxID=3364330 RepID=UPI0037C53A18